MLEREGISEKDWYCLKPPVMWIQSRKWEINQFIRIILALCSMRRSQISPCPPCPSSKAFRELHREESRAAPSATSFHQQEPKSGSHPLPPAWDRTCCRCESGIVSGWASSFCKLRLPPKKAYFISKHCFKPEKRSCPVGRWKYVWWQDTSCCARAVNEFNPLDIQGSGLCMLEFCCSAFIV